MDLHQRYPALSDLKIKAKRRIPHFMWEYLDSATGAETVKSRNRAALDAVLFPPAVLQGEIKPDPTCQFLGRDYALPVGIAPVGMSGGIWPKAEQILAQTAAKVGIPYCMSTVSTALPEDIGPLAGTQGWFQLYPPRDKTILADMLARIKVSGFHTLVLTVDVPGPSQRERQTRGGLVQPVRMTPRILGHTIMRPEWALRTALHGKPRLKFVESYATSNGSLPSNNHIGYLLRTSPDWDYLKELRQTWDGPLIVKGILRPDDAARLSDEGVDAVWVSNHSGRQFDGAPASISVLADIKAATSLPIIFDSGIEGGLDILRALSLGADFAMMGSGFHIATAALGNKGPKHLIEIIERDIIANMTQLGAQSYVDLPSPFETQF